MSVTPGLFIQIYTDEDVTSALVVALREQGFNAQSALEANMLEADDEAQLAYAASRGMSLMTRNERDFALLARRWAATGRNHGGIIITEPFNRSQFGELLRQTLSLLNALTADDVQNAFVYLSQFR